MKTVHEEARDIPVAHECDVCVVGGSCTGVFAAVSAARLGARVALVENNGFFGGTATASLVNCWHTIYDMTGERQVIGGLTVEIVDRLKKRDAVLDRGHDTRWQFAFNSAELVIELDGLVKEAGVRPFLHARFVRPVIEGDRIVAAVIEDKSGRRAVAARVFIDATGDGDVAVRAGAGTGKRGDLQPPTTTAILSGYGEIEKHDPDFRLGRTVFDPRYPEALPRGFLWHAPVPDLVDTIMVSGTRVTGADCSDADALTDAEMEGRRQVRAMCDLLHRHIEGGENIRLVALPSHIGVRETNHVRCLHTLTEEDLLSGREFHDSIGCGTYPVDIHHQDKPGVTWRHLDGREVYGAPGRPTERSRWRPEGDDYARYYRIPYRSLVPGTPSNLLVAGRLMDADRGAYGAIRVMVNCNQTGQAAGTAAYLALDGDVPVRDVVAEQLRGRLREQGALPAD